MTAWIPCAQGYRIAIRRGPAKELLFDLPRPKGLDPTQEVEWRQYPANLLALAVDKGEVQALAEIDPLPLSLLRKASSTRSRRT